MGVVAENWSAVNERVQAAAKSAGRDGSVRLVAVSKRHGAAAVCEAFEAGARDFGESYVQELMEKRAEVERRLGPRSNQINWHFIGRIQRNKLRKLGEVSMVHSVDRRSILTALDGRLEHGTGVLIQVRLGGEETKAGFDVGEVRGVIAELLKVPTVTLKGLMTIPPPFVDEAEQRAHFRCLRQLLGECREAHGAAADGLSELSMGMSSDYRVAIEEGATLVRVGTAIFGQRT